MWLNESKFCTATKKKYPSILQRNKNGGKGSEKKELSLAHLNRLISRAYTKR